MHTPTDVAGLLSFWDFQEESGRDRVSRGPIPHRLREAGGAVECVRGGVFGPCAARLGSGSWLRLPRTECPALDIHGPDAQVTLVAWIKREATGGYSGCQAVAGMWNEHGLRQYCLFLNLKIHGSSEQVGAHISATGGATPGHKYCMEAAIGATPVPLAVWQCVAISYDGAHARAYLNGRLDERAGRNPCPLPGGIFGGGAGGADFTVGAVQRPERVDEELRPHGAVTANNFHGLLGGLAVFGRALSDEEIRALAGPLAQEPAREAGAR